MQNLTVTTTRALEKDKSIIYNQIFYKNDIRPL